MSWEKLDSSTLIGGRRAEQKRATKETSEGGQRWWAITAEIQFASISKNNTEYWMGLLCSKPLRSVLVLIFGVLNFPSVYLVYLYLCFLGRGLAMSCDNSERNWGVQCRSREWFCQQQHSEILKPRKRDRSKIGHFCPFSLLMFKERLPGTFVFALITVLKRWKQLKAAAVKFWSSLVWSET